MSSIVSTPGRALTTRGIEFTTIAAVARSPWTPPLISISTFGHAMHDHAVGRDVLGADVHPQLEADVDPCRVP